MELTNIHTHIFTASHTPPIQLYYMVKDIIIRALKQLPIIKRFRIPIAKIDNTKRVPIILRVLGSLFSPFARNKVKSMLDFIITVSNITVDNLKNHANLKNLFSKKGKLTLHLLIKFFHERMFGETTFRQVLVDLVTTLYEINNTNLAKPITQRELLEKFLRSLNGNNIYKRIVILSMDFDTAFKDVYNPGFDRKKVNYDFPLIPFNPKNARFKDECQAEKLLKVVEEIQLIKKAANYNSDLELIPFYCADPRSYQSPEDALKKVTAWLKAGFKGLKIYMPLGYLAEDYRLELVFDYCLKEQKPIIAHCGRGGAGRKGSINCSDLAHPYYWIPVLKKLYRENIDSAKPGYKFKLCLAHFDALSDLPEVAWWDEIITLIEMYYGNPLIKVYVDVSANFINNRAKAKSYFKLLKEKAYDNNKARDNILYGSDWWMQLYDCNELEYYHAYFTDYQNKSYYPGNKKGEGSISLQQTFEKNAEEFLENT